MSFTYSLINAGDTGLKIRTTLNQLLQDANDGNFSGTSGGSLVGTKYVYVSANGTDIENATELQAAYDLAKTMSPSLDNIITVIAAPGNYKFPLGGFILDTEYINLVSLDGNRSVIIDLDVDDIWVYDAGIPSEDIYGLKIYANNIHVKGFIGALRDSISWGAWWQNDAQPYKTWVSFDIGDNLPNTIVENCLAGAMSFSVISIYGDPISGITKVVSSTFLNCDALYYSFGHACNASGTFINCNSITEYGQTYNSVGGFGGSGIASGTFINCNGDLYCFGGAGIASGIFINCKATLDVNFGANIFGIPDASGTFTNCISGGFSFGKTQTYFDNGILIDPSSLTGKLYYCRIVESTNSNNRIPNVTFPGRTYYCVDGDGEPNNQ